MDRTLFGKPIRKSTTELFYTEKVSVEDFALEIKDVDGFVSNLRSLHGKKLTYHYIEEWAEIFLAYCEIEEEPNG